MEGRVTRLEVLAERTEQDLQEIKSDQKGALGLLAELRLDIAKLPTSGGLWGMIATVILVAVAMIAIFVGILTYLQGLPQPLASIF